MSSGWNTSRTTNIPGRLFDRSTFGRDVARFLSTLHRVPIPILLVRSPIVLALFLVFRLLFLPGRFRHGTPYTQDAAQPAELPKYPAGTCSPPGETSVATPADSPSPP